MNTIKHLLATALVACSFTSFAQTSITIETKTDSTTTTVERSIKPRNRVRSDFNIYLGFNNMGGTLPAGYEFRPVASRFVALSWQHRIPLAINSPTKLRLITGPEIAWNNFMFEGRNMLTQQNGQLIVEQADTDLRKSKLVTTQLNLPVMLNVSFPSRLSLSVGGYIGMRLDSYTKVQPVGATRVREHATYNLNPVRWGLATELGYRGCAKIFFRYEPESPFRTGQGPDARVWAVGLKL